MEQLLLAPMPMYSTAQQQSSELSSPEGNGGGRVGNNPFTAMSAAAKYFVDGTFTGGATEVGGGGNELRDSPTTTILDQGHAWPQQSGGIGMDATANSVNDSRNRHFSGATSQQQCTPPLSAPSSASTVAATSTAFYSLEQPQRGGNGGIQHPQSAAPGQHRQQQYFFVNTPPPTNTTPCSAGPYGTAFKY